MSPTGSGLPRAASSSRSCCSRWASRSRRLAPDLSRSTPGLESTTGRASTGRSTPLRARRSRWPSASPEAWWWPWHPRRRSAPRPTRGKLWFGSGLRDLEGVAELDLAREDLVGDPIAVGQQVLLAMRERDHDAVGQLEPGALAHGVERVD